MIRIYISTPKLRFNMHWHCKKWPRTRLSVIEYNIVCSALPLPTPAFKIFWDVYSNDRDLTQNLQTHWTFRKNTQLAKKKKHIIWNCEPSFDRDTEWLRVHDFDLGTKKICKGKSNDYGSMEAIDHCTLEGKTKSSGSCGSTEKWDEIHWILIRCKFKSLVTLGLAWMTATDKIVITFNFTNILLLRVSQSQFSE